METKLIEKGAGKWCVHTVEGDVHVAKLHYRGQGDWRATVAKNTEDVDDEVEWKLAASTVEDAHAAAVQKATENGVIPELLREKITSETEQQEKLFMSLLVHQIDVYFQHARRLRMGGAFMSGIVSGVIGSMLEGIEKDRIEPTMEEFIAHLRRDLKTALAEKESLEKQLDEGKKALFAKLREVGLTAFEIGNDPEEPPTAFEIGNDAEEPPKH